MTSTGSPAPDVITLGSRPGGRLHQDFCLLAVGVSRLEHSLPAGDHPGHIGQRDLRQEKRQHEGDQQGRDQIPEDRGQRACVGVDDRRVNGSATACT